MPDFWRGGIIFSFAEGQPWRFIRDWGATAGGGLGGGGGAVFEVTHVEGMSAPLGSGGKGAAQRCCMLDCSVGS